MIPCMKKMAATCYERSNVEKTKAMDKQEQGMQQLFSMKGKGQCEIRTPMRGDVATPLAALSRTAIGPRGQPPGTTTTNPKEVVGVIREAHGEMYTGSIKEGKVQKIVDDYMENTKKYIYKSKEDELEDIMAEDVQEEIRTLTERAGGMGQWTPTDLKLPPITACERLVQIPNAVEKGASWPTAELVAGAAFMAKEEGIVLDPLSYRVLTMLPASYRLYPKIRLRRLQPWIADGVTPEIYTGVEGQWGGGCSLRNNGKDGTSQTEGRSMHRRGSRCVQMF